MTEVEYNKQLIHDRYLQNIDYYKNRYQNKREYYRQKYQENREKLIEYSTNYYIKHRDTISDKKHNAKYHTTKIMCDICDCEQYENNMGRHILTKKHMNNIYNANENQNQNQN